MLPPLYTPAVAATPSRSFEGKCPPREGAVVFSLWYSSLLLSAGGHKDKLDNEHCSAHQ